MGSGQHGVKDWPCGTGGQIMAQFNGKGDAGHIAETICRIIPDVGRGQDIPARGAIDVIANAFTIHSERHPC